MTFTTQGLLALTLPSAGVIAIVVDEKVIQPGRESPLSIVTAVKEPVVAQVVLSVVHLRIAGPEV